MIQSIDLHSMQGSSIEHTARELVRLGFKQVSRSHCTIAALDLDWAKRCLDGHQYRRVFSRSVIHDVDERLMMELRRLGAVANGPGEQR
jgi:hypothetical protein